MEVTGLASTIPFYGDHEEGGIGRCSAAEQVWGRHQAGRLKHGVNQFSATQH